MPEEIFDLFEDLFDETQKRRKKRKKGKKKLEKTRRDDYLDAAPAVPQRRTQSSSGGGLLGRIAGMFQPVPPQPEPEPDPLSDLEHAHQQQIRLLNDVRQSVAEVTDARQRMQERANRNAESIREHEAMAAAQVRAGHEDMARISLERKRLAMSQSAEIERELTALAQEQTQLLRAEARLEAKIEAFQMRREVLHSQRASAEAQSRMSELYGGISEESSDVAFTLKRIEAHTNELRSRGAAIDQMLDEGLVDGVEDPQSRFDRRLELSSVDDDLERLRREATQDRSMVVRILGGEQYRLDGGAIDALNELDRQLEVDLAAGDGEHFNAVLRQMVALLDERGATVPDDEIVTSNAIIPPAGVTVEEIRALLGDEGLIPG